VGLFVQAYLFPALLLLNCFFTMLLEAALPLFVARATVRDERRGKFNAWQPGNPWIPLPNLQHHAQFLESQLCGNTVITVPSETCL
jgi:hypothetical protein